VGEKRYFSLDGGTKQRERDAFTNLAGLRLIYGHSTFLIIVAQQELKSRVTFLFMLPQNVSVISRVTRRNPPAGLFSYIISS